MVPLALIAGNACTPSAEPDTRMEVSQDDAGRSATSKSTPSGEDSVARFPGAGEDSTAAITFSVINAPNGTFGYDILRDGKLLIHQTNLPGQPGVEGCRTRADAEKLAAFVIDKIKKGEMPPTVTTDELEFLGLEP